MNTTHPLPFLKIPLLSEIQSGFPGINSLLFDMDGTLFDTEKYHIEAFQSIGKTHQVRPPFGPQEVHNLMIGKADHLVFDIIKTWENFPSHWSVTDFVNTKNKIFLETIQNVVANDYFPLQMQDLLHSAKKTFKMALVTSSEKTVTHALLKISGLDNFFDVVLTRDDCPKHKPDPWPYIEAIRLLNINSKDALIFEDSGVGLSAAMSSGAHIIKAQWY